MPVALADRMRLYRQRLKLGLRCVLVELRETEINRLVVLGHLQEDRRNDLEEIRTALHSFFDDTLGREA